MGPTTHPQSQGQPNEIPQHATAAAQQAAATNGITTAPVKTIPQAPLVPVTKAPFAATRADAWFAAACFVLGTLFVRWLFFNPPWQGWGVTVFTFLYAGTVLVYARAKQVKAQKASWYWLAILLLTGASYAIWPAGSMTFYTALLLFGSAVYWCGSLFGILTLKKTSNYLPMDTINLLFCVPFRNFSCWFRSVAKFRTEKARGPSVNGADNPAENTTKNTVQNAAVNSEVNAAANPPKPRSALYVVLGLVFCAPLLAYLVPLLVRADGGGNFTHLLEGVASLIERFFDALDWEVFIDLIFGFPVALFLCGLIAGSAHKRYTVLASPQSAQKTLFAARVLPPLTLTVVLGVVSALYALFIACQLPYFFSAFTGVRPEGYEVYSAYARQGFFELCGIAAFNLLLLGVASLFSKTQRMESRLLRAFNILLSALTLLLIATAFSKMMLYIDAYGLSAKRVLTLVFMVFLAAVCLGVVVLQFARFSILRFAAVLGAAMLCALSLCNLDGVVTRYNADRYIAGTLPEFDIVQLYGSGNTGLEAWRDVCEKDGNMREFYRKAEYAFYDATFSKGTSRDNISDYLVRQELESE